MSSLQIEDYHVGIICALDSEMAAVEAMFDDEHETIIAQNTHDHNAYSTGRIHAHNVVVACLPAGVDGLAAAATVAKDMSRTFSQLRFGLLVGIGGGIPDLEHGIDIRLGDIVVSQPTGTTGGAVQYDKGKSKAGGDWERKGMLNAPPVALLTALQKLKARHLRHDSSVSSLIADMLQRFPKMVKSGYAFPGRDQDRLKRAIQRYEDGEANAIIDYEVVNRSPRETNDPEIHYGVIASGNQVIKDEVVRDRLRRDCDALCVEMEAAGLMNEFPCLVIRGICDYADAHKNDRWHRYAAAAAAAYAKELLLYVSVEQSNHEKPVQQILGTIDQHFQQFHTHHTRQEAHLQQQETHYQTDKQRDCHRAFKTSNYEEQKNRNPERAPGTCRWLLEHPKYRQWQVNHHSDLVWISADPGCGKSVLSKSLVDHDLCGNYSDADTVVCYFFFKDNGIQDGLATALCAILHQLFNYLPQLIHHALPAWLKDGNKVASEVDELWRILLAAVASQEVQSVVCVLDALDECRDVDRSRLISKLCQFYNDTAKGASCNTRLKFLVTSRPYDDIEYHFGYIASSLPSIRLRGEDQNDQIREEIDLVVRQCVRDISKEFRLASTTAEVLEEKLLAMQHRTYLWLYLAISSIRETFSQSLHPDQESIETLPASVDEAYEQILSKVNHKQTKTVRAILKIILGASRPLTVGEMSLALGVATSKTIPQSLSDLCVNEDHLVLRIRHWCGLFVFINHSRLYLIHQTAKEFLFRDPTQSWIDNGQWKHCLSTTEIEHEMARVYILYLCLEDFENQELDTQGTIPVWHPKFPSDKIQHEMYFSRFDQQKKHVQMLFGLASESWADHWCNVAALPKSDIKDKVWMLYDTQSRRFSRWAEVMQRSAHLEMTNPAEYPLVLAAYNGHVDIVHQLLDENLEYLEVEDDVGNTALIRASHRGHDDIVRILIEAGANIDTQGKYYGTALQDASSKGHDKVVRILLDAGANVDAQGGESRSALQAASYHGHEEVVQMLLDAGADINAHGGQCDENALEAASFYGHDKVVQMLLDAGADVNAQGESNWTALRLASLRRCDKVVRMLLDAGAAIHTYGAENESALQDAAYGGSDQVVQTLLDAGADVNAQGGEFGSALGAASFKGHDKVVRMLLDAGAEEEYALQDASMGGSDRVVQTLLDAGADVNAQGGEYGSALGAASLEGHDKVVRILLDAGADVNTRERYSTVLQYASLRGHGKIVQMLLDAGADVHAQGGKCGTALQDASYCGHDKVVQMLLDAGADVNTQGGEYGSALGAAASKGHDKVVQMLLDAGADVNAQGGHYGSALGAASFEGHDKVVQMLLDAGAKVDAQGGGSGTALQAASSRGHDKVVQMLLDAGADIHALRADNKSVLQDASWRGHDKVVKILLDAGANVHAQGGESGTALQAASWNGHDKVVQMLLDAGADVNLQEEEHGSALQAASYCGCDKVVQMLLDAGADVNARGGQDDSTALETASFEGHDEVVQMLLDAGADVNAQGGYFGNALEAASYCGHEKVVQILLDAGADVNTQGGRYGSVLGAASSEGHDKVVQILLDAGANVNTQGERHRTALQAASSKGHEKVVQLLLDAGADVNALDGSALQAALRKGHTHIAQLLYEYNATDTYEYDYAREFFVSLSTEVEY